MVSPGSTTSTADFTTSKTFGTWVPLDMPSPFPANRPIKRPPTLREQRSVQRGGGLARPAQREAGEVAAHHRDRHVVDGHLADGPVERAGVRVAVENEVRRVLEDGRRGPGGAEGGADLAALALERCGARG